ncbi:hypothetical protein AMEX_G4587 [Astyanax mexicanus]|uniref:Uncharacterized protein n=1 Tax=Astyanax mexicanus TaxID=7994 RepID=A0A8T2MBB2_ASTMX|nr:hypothetical protein AMEX_G4587 [Astyanax mexicanus]
MNVLWCIIREAPVTLLLLLPQLTKLKGLQFKSMPLHCKDICSPGQCVYPVPEEALSNLMKKLDEDCEAEWFTKDGTLLADGNPSAPNKNLPSLVISVTPANLSVLYCTDGLQYKMTCHGSGYHSQVIYAGTYLQLFIVMGFIGHRLFLLLVLAEVILIIFFIIFLIFYRSPKSKPQVKLQYSNQSRPTILFIRSALL